MNNVHLIVCTQGEMNIREVWQECRPDNWLPLLVMRMNGDILLPTFDTAEMAYKFAKRNLPPAWRKPFATIQPNLNDARLIDEKGWKVAPITFPRYLVDVVDFDIEIVEFEDEERIFKVTR